MYIFLKIALISGLLLVQLPAHAQTQRLQHTDFKETIGMPNRVLKCIAEDGNGIIWSASEHALQWFDGSGFHVIPYGNGPHEVPGLSFNQLYRSPEKELWIFYNKGFSVYQPLTHTFKHYKDIIPALEKEIFVVVAQTEKELVLGSSKTLYYINRQTKKITRYEDNTRPLLDATPYNINNNFISTADSTGIFIQNAGTKAVTYLKKPQPTLAFSLYHFNNKIALYATNHYINFYDLANGNLLKTIPYPAGKYLLTFGSPSNIIQKDLRTVLVLMDDELWELDLLQMEFSKKLVNLTGKNFISRGYLRNAVYDSRGNLWVTSNLQGLIKISGRSQPVHLIGPGNEAQNFVKCFVVNKTSNQILIGTYGKGVMIYDTLGNFIKNFPLASTHGEAALVTSIAQVDEDRYLVLIHSDSRQYIINSKTMTVDSINSKIFSPGYYSELQEIDKGTFFYLSADKKNKVIFKDNQLSFSVFNENEMQLLYAKGPLKARVINLSHLTDNSFFNDCIKKIGLQQIGIQILLKRNSNWLFGTIKGIFEFDSTGNLLHSYNTKSGLPDEYIYSLIIDNNADLWCSHNKGLSRIDKKGRIFNLTKEDGLQADEYNYGAAAKTADGQLFFGGINGLNAFYPNQLNSIEDAPRLLITNISSNENILPADTAFWNVKSLKLPFENNQVKIKFSAIGNKTGTYYNYQYRVKGLDYKWKDLGHTREINLALPSGNYVVEIAVANSFNEEMVAQKTIAIEIVPPYYQRWWFLALAILLLLGMAAWVLQVINKSRYNKKLQYLKMQQQLEYERQRISRDLHDNMGAYTTALLANVEKLRIRKGEDDELLKMKNNADNILNSLRETIWVLNNKEISVADFSDAFKTYCFKQLQNFEDINFEAEEDIESNKILTAAEAIHFDKILKEAFQNIIKHSGATQITFTIISTTSTLSFTLADNGKGFDQAIKSKGNGVENMQWRAKEALAILTINAAAGKGSTVKIELNS